MPFLAILIFFWVWIRFNIWKFIQGHFGLFFKRKNSKLKISRNAHWCEEQMFFSLWGLPTAHDVPSWLTFLRTANGLNTMGIHYDYTHSVHCSQTKKANLIRHIALFSHFCYDLGNKKISLAVTSEIWFWNEVKSSQTFCRNILTSSVNICKCSDLVSCWNGGFFMAKNQKEVKTRGAGRTRNFVGILYPESAPKDWREKLAEAKIEALVSPLHDKDKNPDGEPKKSRP